MKATKQIRREAKQLFRLCLVGGLLNDTRVRQAVSRVLEAKRRESFTLLTYFLRLVKLELSRHTAEVESAISLPAALQASILSDLERVYGPGITTSFALNAALIGGGGLEVGSDVYDGGVGG